MKLQNGKLYETRDGRRFRVTWDKITNIFTCPRSYPYAWEPDGISTMRFYDNLVREVEEKRWVPIQESDIWENKIVRKRRGHWQMLVTREEAQRRAPNYRSPDMVATAAKPPAVQSGLVDLTYGFSFDWEYESATNSLKISYCGNCVTLHSK